MAKSKLMLNNEWGDMFLALPDEKVGQLVKALFLCHNGRDASLEDPTLAAIFSMMSAVVCENNQKYEDKCKKNAENRAKRNNVPERPSTTVNDRQRPKVNKIKEKEIKENKDLKEKGILTDTPKESPAEAEPLMVAAKQIVDHLNEKAGTHYRSFSKATVDLIRARLNDHWEMADFFTVIDKKCAEWKGTDHEQYLRPETLFARQHFESYLNQPDRPPDRRQAGNKFKNFPARNDQEHKDLVAKVIAMQ